jgi:hypothetical protein
MEDAPAAEPGHLEARLARAPDAGGHDAHEDASLADEHAEDAGIHPAHHDLEPESVRGGVDVDGDLVGVASGEAGAEAVRLGGRELAACPSTGHVSCNRYRVYETSR